MPLTRNTRFNVTPDLVTGSSCEILKQQEGSLQSLPESQRGEIRSPFHYCLVKMENRYSLLGQLWCKDFMEQNKTQARFPTFTLVIWLLMWVWFSKQKYSRMLNLSLEKKKNQERTFPLGNINDNQETRVTHIFFDIKSCRYTCANLWPQLFRHVFSNHMDINAKLTSAPKHPVCHFSYRNKSPVSMTAPLSLLILIAH